MIDEAVGAPPTRFWQTLRFRFGLTTAGLLLAVMLGFGGFVYWNMARSLSHSVDESLRLNASQALAAVEIEAGAIDLPDGFVRGGPLSDLRARGFVLRLLGPDGDILRNFGAYPGLPVQPESIDAARDQRDHFATLADDSSGESVRVYTVPILSGERLVGIYQVGLSLAAMRATLANLRGALLIGTPALVLIAGLGGYLLAGRALAPIDAITRTARRISTEDLSARLNLPPVNDEVGRLAATVNDMLARLEDGFRRERRFTQDASHELRTPLAAIQAILEVMGQRRRSRAEYETALADLSEEAGRLQGLAEHLLQLARGDAYRRVMHEQVDLSLLLCDVVDSLRPLAEQRGLSLTCMVADDLSVLGDTDGLISLFANVIENAIKYTDIGTVSVIAGMHTAHCAQVQVTDTGIGIPVPHLPFVFERFYRVDTSRSSNGAGLGLSIARDVVAAHGGTIDIASQPGEGTTVVITLPMPSQVPAL